MLLGHAHYPDTYLPLLAGPVWTQALNWIANMPADLPLGEHAIHDQDMFVNYHEAQLLTREAGNFEAHRHYIDLHYCLAGGEIIEWAPTSSLTATGDYDQEKDYQLYAVPTRASACVMTPGTFVIFYPSDAHLPKITDGQNEKVRKVVVKLKIK